MSALKIIDSSYQQKSSTKQSLHNNENLGRLETNSQNALLKKNKIRISKFELETNPEFGKRTPKYRNDSHKKKMDGEIYRGLDIKTKFCKNHIRVVSKEDTGRNLL